MALWKRAGIFYVKLTAPDGTCIRRSTGTRDRTKAEEYHDKLKAELWDLARLKLKPKRTWDEAALRRLKEKAHKKSYRDDVSRIRWFTAHLRGRTLDQVSRDMIDRIISRHLARRSDRTKDMYVALIRAIFRKAMREWEWHDQIPAFKTYAKGSKVRVRYLTQVQARALLERLPAHQREVVMFALATGLRQGNILGLTWDRVDLGRRLVTIGDGDTKNGEALGVPLNEAALGVLERQRGKHPTHVFTYKGERLRSANTRCWRAALKAEGIEDFRCDLKWGEYAPYCDRFYFAVAPEFPREVLPDGPGLIVADGFGGAVLAESPEAPLAPARRKALTLAFARLAAVRATLG